MKASTDETPTTGTRRTYTAKDQRQLLALAKKLPSVKHAAVELGIAVSTANRWAADDRAAKAAAKARQAEAMRKLRASRKKAKDALPVDSYPDVQSFLSQNVGVLTKSGAKVVKVNSNLGKRIEIDTSGMNMELPDQSVPAGAVVLTDHEEAMVLALARFALENSKDPTIMRAAAQMVLRLMP